MTDFIPLSLLEQMLEQTIIQDAAHVYIGLSGGVDSIVLLDLTYQIFRKNHYNLAQFTAIYINHQLQAEAEIWQNFCQKIACQYKINFISETINIRPQAGESIENFARNHRYQLFFKHVRPKIDILLLAHHLDDQAETVLFRLIKGAGPKGLSGMVSLYHYQNRRIFRPLLSIPKYTIINYALKNKLDYIQDPSNNSINYDRNFLRKNIIPALSSRFGGVAPAIARGAKHYRQQQLALDYFIQQELCKIQVQHQSTYYCLDFNLFAEYPGYIQENLMRYWLELHQYSLPSEKKITQILHQFHTAKSDKIPEISWGAGNQYILRKYQSKIFMNKKQNLENVKLFNIQKASVQNNIQIKTRISGQKVYFFKKKHSVVLKKFLQTLGVPAWDRRDIPLYFYQEKYLIAVEGYWVDEIYQA